MCRDDVRPFISSRRPVAECLRAAAHPLAALVAATASARILPALLLPFPNHARVKIAEGELGAFV